MHLLSACFHRILWTELGPHNFAINPCITIAQSSLNDFSPFMAYACTTRCTLSCTCQAPNPEFKASGRASVTSGSAEDGLTPRKWELGLGERAGGRRGGRRARPMSHVSKRFASAATKLATLSTSHLKQFPPKEAVIQSLASGSEAKTAQQPNFFDAESWASLQPANPATIAAFAHRIGLGKLIPEPFTGIEQACTHPSFVPFFTKYHPDRPVPVSNGNLSVLGNSLLGLFATEHVNTAFPHLPTRVMKAAVSAYVGPTTCQSIAKEMGAGQILRWNRTVSTMSMYAGVTLSSDFLYGHHGRLRRPGSLTRIMFELFGDLHLLLLLVARFLSHRQPRISCVLHCYRCFETEPRHTLVRVTPGKETPSLAFEISWVYWDSSCA
jgi:dsRNA-specific ribonuclease